MKILIHTADSHYSSHVLLQKGRIEEAEHRYNYALKKATPSTADEDNNQLHELRFQILLNLSRCRRKMDVSAVFCKQFRNKSLKTLFSIGSSNGY